MSEETFVRVLERRAHDVQPRHLRFEDVRELGPPHPPPAPDRGVAAWPPRSWPRS